MMKMAAMMPSIIRSVPLITLKYQSAITTNAITILMIPSVLLIFLTIVLLFE